MPTTAPRLATRLVHWTTPTGIRDSYTPLPAPTAPDPSEIMPNTTPPPLAPEHAARYRMADDDLTRARGVDVLTLSRPRLAREYERLRAALADTLQLVRDIATTDDPNDRGL